LSFRSLAAWAALIALSVPGAAWAHVGSPLVTAAGSAGPYRLSVMITPPPVAPGVASVQVDASNGEQVVREVRLSASMLGAPSPSSSRATEMVARPAAGGDQRRFSAELWIASPGPWRLAVVAGGSAGAGELSVIVPQARRIGAALRVALVALRIVLALGLAALMSRLARPRPGRPRKAPTILAAMAFAAVAVTLGGGVPPADCAPGSLDATVGAGQLSLRLAKPGLACGGDAGRLLPDHGHLMHLFLVRLPGLDRLLHLHPREVGGRFVQDVPERSQGRYQAFADVVDATGAPATALGEVTLPAAPDAPLAGDDAAGEGPAIERADLRRTIAPLSAGARLLWERDGASLRSGRLTMLTFRIEDARGAPAADLQPYMGMLGHAVLLRHDRAVFAHVHPTGSVPMAASAALGGRDAHGDACAMPEHAASSVTFPYGFPSPGTYRIFVQIKRHDRVETAVFDALVE
jgi:hypothetical protein